MSSIAKYLWNAATKKNAHSLPRIDLALRLFTIDGTTTHQTFEDFTGTFTGVYMSTPFEYIITQSATI